MKRKEIPMGFAMALAKNQQALEKFSMLSEMKKQEIIEGTHSVQSKEEMEQYVNSLVNNK